jgi:hypothetical protein
LVELPEEVPEELQDFQNFVVLRHDSTEHARCTLTVFLVRFYDTDMKQRFYLYQRRGTFYLQDSRTGKQQSLETKDKRAAQRLLEVKRQTTENPGFNQFILKTCLTTGVRSSPNGLGEQSWSRCKRTASNLPKPVAPVPCAPKLSTPFAG